MQVAECSEPVTWGDEYEVALCCQNAAVIAWPGRCATNEASTVQQIITGRLASGSNEGVHAFRYRPSSECVVGYEDPNRNS